MVVQITTAFPSVPHMQSAFCPGEIGFHLLCISEAVFRCAGYPTFNIRS
jgi:hypothetical protein